MRRITPFVMLVCVAIVHSLIVPITPAEAASTTRISGASRYSTAVAVSRASPPLGTGTVFLASGEGFADALAAGPVAAAEDARLLLTMPSHIPPGVFRELTRLDPDEIVLVGGTASLSASVATQAATLGATVTRIGGADRIQTALLLNDRLLEQTHPAAVWVVDSESFSDAIAAGAVAARFGHALVLAAGPTSSLRAGLVERFGAARYVIAGGTASVSSATATMLGQIGSVERHAGATRYQTAVLINRAFTASATGGEMLLASGASYADGLVAGVLAGARGVPLYLVPQRCLLTPGVPHEVTRLGISTITVVGGTAAVSATSARLQVCPPPMPPIAQQMLAAINAERAAAGAPPLALHAGLNGIAQPWTTQMAAAGQATHNPVFCDRTLALGFGRCGEAIAWTSSSDPGAPVQWWMGSAPHRALMLNAAFTHVGVGAAQSPAGYWYWTLDFGG